MAVSENNGVWNEEESELKTAKDASYVYTILSFAIVFIAVGLPLWWKTTEVYRMALSYDQIAKLPTVEMVHVVPVTVVVADGTVSQKNLLDQLLSYNSSEGHEKFTLDAVSPLHVQYHWKVRPLESMEEEALHESTYIKELDKKLSNLQASKELGHTYILILPKEISLADLQATVGCHRWMYIRNMNGQEKLVINIINLAKLVTQEVVLKKVFTPPSATVRRKPDKASMRSLSATPAFDITFSLIVPEPHLLDVRWDIATAVEAYVKPFLERLSLLADVDVKSQVLYMISLNVWSKFDSQKGEHKLHTDQLPLIINPVEAKLGSYASMNPTLNFVVYVPPQGQSPLQIYDERGEILSTNAFLSPRWGGFLIYNIPRLLQDSRIPPVVYLDMQRIMEIFLSQLRDLIGLPDLTRSPSPSLLTDLYIMHNEICSSDWEVDFLLRRHSQELLSAAMASLHSLGQLLGTIENIVIRDDIGQKIYSSLKSVETSIHLLNRGHLKEAFLQAKSAFINSEQAFFDPSLLALLYFPDDQKYAIYIPLFLPVSIPVVLSLYHLWQFYKGTKLKKTS